MVTQRRIYAFIIGLFILTSSLLSLAEPVVRIDRSVIALDDTFTLTIRVDQSGSVSAPDLTPLESDFMVLANSQSSQHVIRNGRSESWTEWTITLMAKRKGQLTIPALTVGGEQTQPVSLTVQASIPKATGYLEPVYLESEVDLTTAYVQQQVIFTLRIFQSIQLDSMNISEPAFENAVIEKLGQNSFQRRIQNTPYRVHELRYAIFPQQTGELIIPEIIFTASETVARRSMFTLPGQGKLIRKMSEQHTIKVIPAPASYNDELWLPARDLSLTESWSQQPDNIQVGDSITRTITLKADGLLGSQLPPIRFNQVEGAKFYPDQGSTDTTPTDRGVISTRIDSAAIIATREGLLELPEIRISWWNTDSQQLQQAVLPARQITVKAAAGSTTVNRSPLTIDHGLSAISDAPATTTSSSFWPILSAVLAAGWLATLIYFLRPARRQATSASPIAADSAQLGSEKQAFKQLRKACESNDSAQARSAFIRWAGLYWQDTQAQSLQTFTEHCSGTALAQQITELDQALYGRQNQTWQGDKLLSEVTALRAKPATSSTATQDALPPLYSA